ncbi:MAG: NADH-quinone oxidoreductase subunit NuoE [Bacteroidetes bacterium]|nr:MAG: NADH-quinone oxidoreductase subunit NuoE [Bacteroidota bacterium]
MKTAIENILEDYPNAKRDSLIPILQSIQEKDGYLSRESVDRVAKHINIPSSKIFGVATFYNQFKFSPPGKYHIQVCRGTACHVLGSSTVLSEIENTLKIKTNQTTADGLFSIEVVACIGACGLAPVISINGEFHAKVTTESISKILDTYRKKEVEDEK